MKNWIEQLLPIRNEFMDGCVDEPMDGDDVDELCKIIKAKLNLNEGNITEEEYNNILDSSRGETDKYKTHIVMIGVGKICDRRPLESIEGVKFNSIDEVRNALCYDENDPIAVEDVAIMDMCYFMDSCNNTDDDTPKEDIIDISKNWIGYVEIKA